MHTGLPACWLALSLIYLLLHSSLPVKGMVPPTVGWDLLTSISLTKTIPYRYAHRPTSLRLFFQEILGCVQLAKLTITVALKHESLELPGSHEQFSYPMQICSGWGLWCWAPPGYVRAVGSLKVDGSASDSNSKIYSTALYIL